MTDAIFNSGQKDLSAILAEGYPDNADAVTTPINLWGVTIDPSNPKNAKVSVVLMHFLRARYVRMLLFDFQLSFRRNLSVRDAREMLIATLRWRDEFNVDAATKEDFPSDVFENLGHVYGHDKDGRPVV